MRRIRPRVVALLAGAVLIGAVPLAHAAFLSSAKATTSFSAAQLAAPTGVTARTRCTLGLLGVVLAASLDVAWTPSGSTWATGQTLVVTDGQGVVVETQSLGPSASSATVALPLVAGGTYTARIRATYSSWTSPAATASSGGC